MISRLQDIEKEIFMQSNAAFEQLALQIFLFQYSQNDTYRQFCNTLHVDPSNVTKTDEIPFLPIQFFKSRKICSTVFEPTIIFESSGTTGSINSRHYVKNVELYEKSFTKTFQLFYGDSTDYCIIGLLPSYLEKGNASLVYMVNELIRLYGIKGSGFFLNSYENLYQTLLQNEAKGIQTLLIGVTYALLDYAEQYPIVLKNTVVIETGGMKGRRQELTRKEVHTQLKNNLGIAHVHSEYGMTELLSQAYSKGNGIFNCPPWMKILIRSEDDPFNVVNNRTIKGKMAAGAINIIDLANVYSCAFIATDDIGKLYPDDTFEVLGRMDNSDIRGCGLMLL